MHAVAAIGATHEQHLRKQASRQIAETDGLHPFALRQCNKAIKSLVAAPAMAGMKEGEIMRALTASVLFLCFENMTGNRNAAVPHILHARRLAEQCRQLRDANLMPKNQPSFPLKLDTIDPLVIHYEIQLESVVRDAVPPERFHIFDATKPTRIRNVADARLSLKRAIGSLFTLILGLEDNHDPASVTAVARKKAPYVSWLKRWDESFTDYLARETYQLDSETFNSCRLLKTHHAAATTLASVDYAQGEAHWALFDPHFRTITRLSAEIIDALPKRGLPSQPPQTRYLNPGMGLTEPLYLAAARSADPAIVQQANSLLARLPSNEGAYSSWRLQFLELNLSAATGKHHHRLPTPADTPTNEIIGNKPA